MLAIQIRISTKWQPFWIVWYLVFKHHSKTKAFIFRTSLRHPNTKHFPYYSSIVFWPPQYYFQIISDELESHRLSAHWELEFHCGLCPPPPARPKHFAHLKDALKHLETAHQIIDAADLDAEGLTSRGLLRLPVDLRSLKCRLCVDKHILVSFVLK